jgi:uncharacterized protein
VRAIALPSCTDVRVRSLVAFWALAFLVSWGSGTVVAVSAQGSLVNGVHVGSGALPLPFALAVVLLLVSAFGPAIAAVAVSAAEAGPRGVRALLGQVLTWRAGLGWYAAALLLPTLLTLLATTVWALATGVHPARWLQLPPTFQLLALPIGPWGEEIGWRGFAQPRLQAGLRWPLASVIVGVMWGAWHQWPLLTPAAGSLDPAGLGVFFVYIVSAAVLIGWAYNGAGRRLPLGWAGHAGLNAAGPSAAPFGLVAAVFAVAAVAVGVLGRRAGEE